MAHNGVRNINTFPPTQPKFPTQIHVFAIHEENALVEAAEFFESFSPNQYCCARTPCCCARLGIVDFRMLSWLLACFAHRNCRIAQCMIEQPFQAALFQFCVGIQQEYELTPALTSEQI